MWTYACDQVAREIVFLDFEKMPEVKNLAVSPALAKVKEVWGT